MMKNLKANQVSYISFSGNLFLTFLKGFFGLLFGSAALVADAFHSLSDLLTSGVVVFGIKLASRPPDKSHHYGHGKIESVASKIVALILIVTGVSLLYSFINSILQEITIPKVGAIWIAIISILFKESMYQYINYMGRKLNSSALIAESWHNRSDALSSVAALIGIVGARMGFPILDPIAGGVVAVLILRMGIKIYSRSIQELIDTAPKDETLDQIRDRALSIPGARNAREIKARMHGMGIYVDLKICVDKDYTVEKGHSIAADVRSLLEKDLKDVEYVFVHVDPCVHGECVEYCNTNEYDNEKEKSDFKDKEDEI